MALKHLMEVKGESTYVGIGINDCPLRSAAIDEILKKFDASDGERLMDIEKANAIKNILLDSCSGSSEVRALSVADGLEDAGSIPARGANEPRSEA